MVRSLQNHMSPSVGTLEQSFSKTPSAGDPSQWVRHSLHRFSRGGHCWSYATWPLSRRTMYFLCGLASSPSGHLKPINSRVRHPYFFGSLQKLSNIPTLVTLPLAHFNKSPAHRPACQPGCLHTFVPAGTVPRYCHGAPKASY